MTFAVVCNIVTMILCIAVLVQSVRLMRAFDTVKGGALTDLVGALDASTNEARRVLGKLTELLRGDLAVTARTISEGKAMIDELTVMTGIANAIAERIVDAASASNRPATRTGTQKAKRPPPADSDEPTTTALSAAPAAPALPAPSSTPTFTTSAAALQPTRRVRARGGLPG